MKKRKLSTKIIAILLIFALLLLMATGVVAMNKIRTGSISKGVGSNREFLVEKYKMHMIKDLSYAKKGMRVMFKEKG